MISFGIIEKKKKRCCFACELEQNGAILEMCQNIWHFDCVLLTNTIKCTKTAGQQRFTASKCFVHVSK